MNQTIWFGNFASDSLWTGSGGKCGRRLGEPSRRLRKRRQLHSRLHSTPEQWFQGHQGQQGRRRSRNSRDSNPHQPEESGQDESNHCRTALRLDEKTLRITSKQCESQSVALEEFSSSLTELQEEHEHRREEIRDIGEQNYRMEVRGRDEEEEEGEEDEEEEEEEEEEMVLEDPEGDEEEEIEKSVSREEEDAKGEERENGELEKGAKEKNKVEDRLNHQPVRIKEVRKTTIKRRNYEPIFAAAKKTARCNWPGVQSDQMEDKKPNVQESR
ncbi:unnamed protein product [Protopolystoma xenopodis]|uniref:Uncharacterized protein n=1 Tax=Protopolystoma xenopodis TaxID=117903 RepID=A0A448WM22_9PLAT|nr:unnamed protein product [Protopolystoma xenopodis]